MTDLKKILGLPHDSAHTHVTGESEYVDDRPLMQGELHVEIVFSPYARAKIVKIDSKKALALLGVKAVLVASDFSHNVWGTIFKDQPLLAEKETTYAGEPVALVVAHSQTIARRARTLVRVQYEKKSAILSIDEAKKKKSFIGSARTIVRGDVKKAFVEAEHQISGRVVIRGADHFYLESHAAVAYPKEDGQVEVHSSSQHPSEVQHVVAHALGLPNHDVTCVVKRMGGAFGGKESQSAPIAAYAALAAQKFGRPARIAISKDDDMVITGKRNPFENEYRVAFDSTGRLQALEVDLFSDAGAYADLSPSIMERAMLHSDNAYFIPHMRVTGQVCRTNYHPHTAFRGFGGPKGVATIERMIEEVAHYLDKDPLEIRRLNCYCDEEGRNVTHYGQVVENNCLPDLFARLEKSSDYQRRRKEIQEYNSGANCGAKRGISLTAVKFGISFTTKFLNQANAFVIVHRDGTLQVTTGATEMGQGVNARISELVASELGLKRSSVRMMATATDKNANTSPTAASAGTDLNGSAALLAVRKIKARLSELATSLFDLPRERWAVNTAGLGTESEIELQGDDSHNQDDPNEDADWETGIVTSHGVSFEDGFVVQDGTGKKIAIPELINEAYLNRVSLSDYAHYRFKGLSFDKLTGKGDAFLYFTQGVAASEVSVDLDTGEVKVLRADILMDLGRPINGALDVGQVTGGFVQGMGWVTTEKLFYNDDGLLLSHSPSTYKIPTVQDTPRDFRVELLANDQNRRNVRGSKAVGEPPLLLCLSVWTAIHDAIRGENKEVFPQLEIPATQEEVLRHLYASKFDQWEKSQ